MDPDINSVIVSGNRSASSACLIEVLMIWRFLRVSFMHDSIYIVNIIEGLSHRNTLTNRSIHSLEMVPCQNDLSLMLYLLYQRAIKRKRQI